MHETRIKLALTAEQMASQLEMSIELYNDIESNLVLPKQEQQKLMHELLEKYEHEG